MRLQFILETSSREHSHSPKTALAIQQSLYTLNFFVIDHRMHTHTHTNTNVLWGRA